MIPFRGWKGSWIDWINVIQKVNPKRNVLFTAIDEFPKYPDEIAMMQKFVEAYPLWLKEHNPDWSMEEARRVANSNIGYGVGYYDRETADKWMSVSDSIAHPVFGRQIPWGEPEKAFEMGKNAK